jgi:hypothetical protein
MCSFSSLQEGTVHKKELLNQAVKAYGKHDSEAVLKWDTPASKTVRNI